MDDLENDDFIVGNSFYAPPLNIEWLEWLEGFTFYSRFMDDLENDDFIVGNSFYAPPLNTEWLEGFTTFFMEDIWTSPLIFKNTHIHEGIDSDDHIIYPEKRKKKTDTNSKFVIGKMGTNPQTGMAGIGHEVNVEFWRNNDNTNTPIGHLGIMYQSKIYQILRCLEVHLKLVYDEIVTIIDNIDFNYNDIKSFDPLMNIKLNCKNMLKEYMVEFMELEVDTRMTASKLINKIWVEYFLKIFDFRNFLLSFFPY